MSEKLRVFSGLIWSGVEQLGSQGLQFVLGLLLARLLSPKDYGLIAMLMIFIAISQTFVDSGFSTALLRKNRPTQEDYSTVFWYNLISASVFYLICVLASTAIADFYNQPELKLLIIVLGISILINALGSVIRIVLTKEKKFKYQAISTVISVIVSGILSLSFALNGFGVWALVVLTLSRLSILNICLWWGSNWKPSFTFSRLSFFDLFGFSWKLLLSSLFDTIFSNINGLVIGKFFSAQSLGFFSRADQFQKLPSRIIFGIVHKVSFPLLAEHQDDLVSLRAIYKRFYRGVSFIIFPLMGLLALFSHQLIEIVLLKKWLPAADYLQILCIVGVLYPLDAINLNILNLMKRSDLFLKLEIVKQLINVMMILTCFNWGVLGLVWGSVVVGVISLFINAIYSNKLIHFGILDQFLEIYPIILATCLMLIFIILMKLFIASNLAQLIILPTLGLLVYIFFCWLMRISEIEDLRHLFKTVKYRIQQKSNRL